MPIVDGILVPRTTLTAAERAVDFPAVNEHILKRRAAVERAASPSARRLAALTLELHGLPPQPGIDQLTAALARALEATARFGFREAQREIGELRRDSANPLAYSVPDAGRYSRAAVAGIGGVLLLARERARTAAEGVAESVTAAAADRTLDGVDLVLAVTMAATRSLHRYVLELVGETLNLGRTAGALNLPDPPEFALRSEQLDRNTCDACTRVHGTIEQVGSDAFYRIMPPSDCYGGGRCRGVMVFGDSYGQVRVPEAA